VTTPFRSSEIDNRFGKDKEKKKCSPAKPVILALARVPRGQGRIAMHRRLGQTGVRLLLKKEEKEKEKKTKGKREREREREREEKKRGKRRKRYHRGHKRCASLPRRTKPPRRTIERGQKSSRCYARRYEAMETNRSRRRLAFSPSDFPTAPPASSLPPPDPPCSLVPLCFPCFPVEQAREFSRFSDGLRRRNLIASSRLCNATCNALCAFIRHPVHLI